MNTTFSPQSHFDQQYQTHLKHLKLKGLFVRPHLGDDDQISPLYRFLRLDQNQGDSHSDQSP